MKKKMMAVLLTVAFLLTAMGSNIAGAATTESNLKLLTPELQRVETAAGNSIHMQVTVKAKGGICINPEFKVIPEEGAPFTITNIKAKNSEFYLYSSAIIMDKGNEITLEYDINVDDYATIGEYSYYITYVDPDRADYDDEDYDEPEPGMLEMQTVIISEKMAPQLSVVSGIEFSGKAGENVTLKFTVENEGELQALEAYVAVGHDDNVLIPEYTPLNQKLGNLAAGKTKEVTVSYKIAEDAMTQRVKLPITMTYKNAKGVSYQSVEQVLYLYIEGTQAENTPAPKPQETSVLLLNTVKQSPSKPKAGEQMTVTFYLENEGTAPITEIKVMATGLSSAGFEPVSSEPYQYIEKISGGAKKKVTMKVKVGKDISEGLNTLNIQYSYVDGNGMERMENVQLYILDVQAAEEEVVISRPKLMVSNFYTDIEEVKAGSIFDFTFEILNTNETIAAKNIKVTVSGSSGTFSVTAGGNSFFVSEIKPGDVAPITINLKASAAATTGAYPIDIKIEYEYEGMVTTGGYSGEVVQEEILLQVKENLRPSVENIYVGWGMVYVNQPATMNFEFYNMGKSMLNNTYVTIEGDFILANGSNSYYIGNIQAGMPEYIEFDVIPLIEGDAVGRMIIHMEDSNGDEVTMEKEFTTYVMGEEIWEDPGYMEPGFEDPGYMEDPSLQTGTDAEKEPVMPLWIFLCIQAAILAIGIPVTRAICLAVYRKKVKDEDAFF